MAILEIENLSLKIDDKLILDTINLSIEEDEFLALIGESGAGKSILANIIMRLMPAGANLTGNIIFDQKNLTHHNQKQMQNLRGNQIAIIAQNAAESLNPLQKIKTQLRETLSLHQKIPTQEIPAGEIHQKMLMMLKQVRLDAAEEILEKLPFQLSGGQSQRVMIAMALAHRPKLLIADEPTTALDVNLQAEILNLLLSLKKEIGMACLFITHNLDIMRNIAGRIAVIDHGKIIEQGKALDILQNPKTKLTARACSHRFRNRSIKHCPLMPRRQNRFSR